MVGRLLRWSRSLVVLLVFGIPVHGQGALSGTLYAPDVGGYVVIACLPSAADGCDEAGSGYAEVVGGGASAAWRIDGLGVGPFLLLAWRDADGDGEGDEEELSVWLDASGEPGLVAAPAAGIALGPTAPSASTNPLPADLVGVWQMTRASAGDYRVIATGQTFSMTSGFSTLLKLRPDGSFLYQFYASGVASGCAFVSSLDTMVGTANWAGGQLVLTPSERSIEVTNCTASGTYDGGRTPVVFDAAIETSYDIYQLRTWTLRLEGGPVPLAYTLLDRPPLATLPARARPDDFAVGTDAPYAELQGLWTPHPGSAIDFYDPVANTYRVPEPDGTLPMWVRFTPGGYEMARAVPNLHGTGVCRKDLIYYERGRAGMVVLEDVGGQGDHFRGHVWLEADEARVIAQVSECGPDDGVVQYPAPLATSYVEWTWWAASNLVPENLSLHCPWPYAEFQGLFCGGSYGVVSMGRRE